MRIIKFVKSGKSKYNLILDDNMTLTLNEEVIIKNNLLVNRKLDKDTLNKLLYENNIEELCSKCINYISIRLRSKKEIINYLNKQTKDETLINNVVDKLEKLGYINDEVFSKCYINDKINLTNYGANKIKDDLKKHNIAEEIIEKYINKIDEDTVKNKINKIIEKSINTNTKYSKNMLISKIFMKLTMLGYDKNLINEQLSNYQIEEKDDIIKKDYDKVFSKLNGKYSGKELEYKIKQKLVQKGHSYDDINNILRQYL